MSGYNKGYYKSQKITTVFKCQEVSDVKTKPVRLSALDRGALSANIDSATRFL